MLNIGLINFLVVNRKIGFLSYCIKVVDFNILMMEVEVILKWFVIIYWENKFYYC